MNDKPKFSDIAEELINYISDCKLIIHNASFDVSFLNAELKRCNMKVLNENNVIDTLTLAKKRFLGQSVSLDSLCKKYNIDLSGREIHGALKDAKLLASVYLELIGGRQSRLGLEITKGEVNFPEDDNLFNLNYYNRKNNIKKLSNTKINQKDYKMHLENIYKIKNSIWKKISN